MEDRYSPITAAVAIQNSGGGGGTSNYNSLSNKPQINSVTLSGNKSLSDLGIASEDDLNDKVDKEVGKGLSENDYSDMDKAIVDGVTTALAGKVDKNGTDRLMTAAEGTKLDGLANVKSIGTGLSLNAVTGELTATGIEVEIDDTIDPQSANPVQNAVIAEALDDKADSDDIPSKTSDLTNDSGFITNTVNNLVNYYLKTETYSASEVDAIVAAIKNSRFEVVSTLPTTDIKTNVIYLVPKSTSQTSNVKDEYINLDGTTAGWEKIGDTEPDLSGYVTTTALNTALADYTTTANLTTLLAAKADATDLAAILDGTNIDSFGDVETALSDKVDKVSGKGLSANDYTNADKTIVDGVTTALAGKQDTISDLATIRSGAAAGATAYQKPQTGIPSTDLASAVQTSLGKADSAYQKPGTGIPSTDLATAVQTSLGKADTALQNLGVKVTATVADDTVSFTNAAITATCSIDGPWINGTQAYGQLSVEVSGTTVTCTLEDDTADGASAYILVREV